jgi:hypothetical protein
MDLLLQGECVVAVLGVEHALKTKPKPPSSADEARAVELPGVLKRRVKELLATPKAARPMDPPELPDFKETHEALVKGLDGDAFVSVLVDLPLEVQAPAVMCWTRAIQYLDSITPLRSSPQLTGAKLRDPSPGEWAEFGWAWRIACEPMVAIDLASAGMLITPMIDHLKVMFPALYAELCGCIQDGLADAIASDPEWVVPWWLQVQLCAILGVSPVSRTLLDDIDKAVAESKAQPKTSTGNLKLTNNDSTPNQRLADK